jgi:predicted Na+-dependent transporter
MNRKVFALLMVTLALLAFASPVFAQPEEKAASGAVNWIAITSGFAMAIASSICALAQGKAIAACLRKPRTQSGRRSRNSIRTAARSRAD